MANDRKDWNPSAYLAFASERARPASDLLARAIQMLAAPPQLVHDLGCGPGNSTRLLRQAFPASQITGIDASPAMIAQASVAVPDAAFAVADVTQFVPVAAAGLVFSNALFQWVPDHAQVMVRIFRAMKQGSVMAVQMPDNLGEPSHRLMREVAQQGPWKTILEQAVKARSSLLGVTGYHNLLTPLASRVEIWRTTYYHPLEGHQGIADMLATTGLKPFLDPLGQDQRKAWLDQWLEAIAPHYPYTDDKLVLYPFPRLFIVAVRGQG